MYEPPGRPFANLAFFWPALVAASASEIAAQAAKQFAALTAGQDGPPVSEPQWASSHTVALELKTVRLRDFTAEAKGSPVLVCAPFALHGASVADFATKHSLVAALSRAGVRRREPIRAFVAKSSTHAANAAGTENCKLELAEGLSEQGSSQMCDFSLHDFGTGTRGFAALEDPNTAVCILPGTELSFAAEVQTRGLLGWHTRVVNHKTAIFRQINKDRAAAHHDALEFPDGEVVLLTCLSEDQRATVLQLPAEPRTSVEAEDRRHVAYVS